MSAARPDPTPTTDPPRVLIFSGKGGVGKTTVAAATGLHTARSGQRTIILSVDIAHSLGDAFDVTERLRDHPLGTPYAVEPGLWLQELDIQEEIFRHWDEVMRYFSVLFTQAGLDNVMAEELAIIPGMEDVIALLYLNEYVQERAYDVIILDLAPTGESLRFVSMPNTLDWYMRRVFKFERNLARVARPLAKRLANLPLPDDAYFQEIERLWDRMEGVDEVLLDARNTSVRLVTNAEKMVVKESERAFMYFNLYGVAVDGIIVNRVLTSLPEGQTLPPILQHWQETHAHNLERIHTSFTGIPIHTIPMQSDEVVGIDRLAKVAETLYGPVEAGFDPAAPSQVVPPFAFETHGKETTLRLHLPGVDRRDLDLYVEQNEFIIRVGSQKRHIPLPRRLIGRRPEHAGYKDDRLTVVFKSTDDHAGTAPREDAHTARR